MVNPSHLSYEHSTWIYISSWIGLRSTTANHLGGVDVSSPLQLYDPLTVDPSHKRPGIVRWKMWSMINVNDLECLK